MNRTSLSDIKKVGSKKLLDYREISERYPYCSCSKVLYLLTLKKLEDPDFNKILSQTAISVPDRKYLASLLDNFSPKMPKLSEMIGKATDNRFFSFTPVEDDDARVNVTPARVAFKTISDNIGVSTVVAGETLSKILFRKATTHTDIDNFLSSPEKHQPIRVNKNKDYSQIKIDDSSIKEDLSIGTEAMAKLYAEQGNPKKALTIYRNLMEKYPEKILYYNTLMRRLTVSEK